MSGLARAPERLAARPDKATPEAGRWRAAHLAALAYPFAATAAAINLFMLALLGQAIGTAALGPGQALGWGALLGVPAALWCGRRLRRLMDDAA